MNRVERLVARAECDATGPEALRGVLDELLACSPAIGAAVALGLLAREPRVKPSRNLLIDPDDAAFRRWRRRVTAASALLSSPAGEGVRHELQDEFGESPELETDVRAVVTGATGVT